MFGNLYSIWLYRCVYVIMLESSLSGLYCPTAFGVGCHACLSCGMVVLLVMPGCSVFHILMVDGRDDCFI